MESHSRGNPGEGLDLQERQAATVGKGTGGGAGCHRKLLGPQCACLPTGSQRAECLFLVLLLIKKKKKKKDIKSRSVGKESKKK